MQAIQLNKAVEMPNSGSANVNDEKIAMIDMAVASI